jgi:hypothetical protein
MLKARTATRRSWNTEAGQATTQRIESLPNLSTFEAPPVYLWTVSRTLELSLQSSLQLSLTVLVCYRSRGKYLALDGVYHPLRVALSSNPTPGKRSERRERIAGPNRPCTLHGPWPRSGGLGRRAPRQNGPSLTPHCNPPLQRELRCWANLFSLAVTQRILVSFFSSAY